MRAAGLCVWLVAMGVAVRAEEAKPAPEDAKASASQEIKAPTFAIRQISFGVQGSETDTNSSRFREYLPHPNGFVLDSLHFAGNEHFRYDLRVEDALQTVARYAARVEPGPFKIDFNFQRIPHRFGNDARSILVERPRSVFLLSDSVQGANQAADTAQFKANPAAINFPFLQHLVQPTIDAAPSINLALQRDRGRLDVGYLPEGKDLGLHVVYFEERRYGNRAAGTSFGFGNVVETAEPIEYRTRDLATTFELRQSWGQVRAGLRYNKFENKYLTEEFDNPFRATDSTDASAYTAPASGSVGGPSFGRISLPPDNDALTGTAGVTVKLPAKTRIIADASISQWTQDSPFIPFSTNTAITTPVVATDLAALPAQSLNGKMDVLSLSLNGTSQPVDKLRLTARFRHYDLDNKTPRIEFPQGYVRFDAVWENIPRISVPYGYKTDRGVATADYDFGKVDLEGGYRLEIWHRDFRETDKTTEGTVTGALRWHPKDWVLLRVSAEHGHRDYAGVYDPEASEDASFLTPQALSNLPQLRRYDQANRDTDRLTGQLQLSPGGNTTIVASYTKAKQNYGDTSYGLISTDSEGFGLDADYSPSEKWGVYAYGSHETFKNFQRGRQSGATPSTNPADDWTSNVKDVVDTFGGGVHWVIVKEKVEAQAGGTYQKVNGNNDLASPPGGTPDFGVGIPNYDDTKIWAVGAELGYHATPALKLSCGGSVEQYRINDSATVGLTYYMPGGFFLAASDGDYRAYILYGRATYVW
jgi:MtrB/PioB family decaheme-associated outer membrane protein